MADVTIRRKTATAAREIKASTHYAYVVGGITLDGSKFTNKELVLEGQCLIKDDVTKKYEKYADGQASPASLVGVQPITPANTTLNAATKVDIIVNGKVYTITNAQLDAILATSTIADVVNMVKAAAAPDAQQLQAVATVEAVNNILTITGNSAGSGQRITIKGTWGVAADEAVIVGILGVMDNTTAQGTGVFPAGKSDPVILDESIQFEPKDDGTNPDVTAGQVLVHGAVYESMLLGVTETFKAALAGAIRFIK